MKLADTVRSLLKNKDSQVWSVTPDASVYEAIEDMAMHKVGALLVTTEEGLVGILSERDYARKVILKGRLSKETRVAEIMTTTVLTVTRDHTVDDCMAIMTRNHIRHLPVVENSKLLGMISIGDLVKWIISRQDVHIEHLEQYISGKYPA